MLAIGDYFIQGRGREKATTTRERRECANKHRLCCCGSGVGMQNLSKAVNLKYLSLSIETISVLHKKNKSPG